MKQRMTQREFIAYRQAAATAEARDSGQPFAPSRAVAVDPSRRRSREMRNDRLRQVIAPGRGVIRGGRGWPRALVGYPWFADENPDAVEPLTPAETSLITDDWFSGYTPKDAEEAKVADSDDRDVQACARALRRLAQQLREGEVERYYERVVVEPDTLETWTVQRDRVEDVLDRFGVALEDASVLVDANQLAEDQAAFEYAQRDIAEVENEWGGRVKGASKPGLEGEREWLEDVLRGLRVKWVEASAAQEREAIARHAAAMRARFRFNRLVEALGADPAAEDVQRWRRSNTLSYRAASDVLAARLQARFVRGTAQVSAPEVDRLVAAYAA